MNTINLFSAVDIEKSVRLTRRLSYPRMWPENPTLRKTEPWEPVFSAYGSVIRDEGLLKAYYTLWWLDRESPYRCRAQGLAYATSRDGRAWEKPHLGIVKEINDGRNNLVVYGQAFDQPTVVRLHDEVDGARYAMLIYGEAEGDGPGLRLCSSSDGVHWNWPGRLVWQTALDRIADTLPFFAADDTATLCWDRQSETFSLYRKVMHDVHLDGEPACRLGVADVKRCEIQRMIAVKRSRDLRVWSRAEVMLRPDWDDEGTDFHRFASLPFDGHSIGLLETHRTAANEHTTAIDLLVSSDNSHWVRAPKRGRALVANPGGSVFVLPNLVSVGERTLVPFGMIDASLRPEALAFANVYGVGFAEIAMGSFVCLENAGDEPGMLRTKAVDVVEGVTLSFQTDDGGYVKAGLRDAQMRHVEGFGCEQIRPLGGSSVDMALRWNQRPVPRAGRYVLEIEALRARIYRIAPT